MAKKVEYVHVDFHVPKSNVSNKEEKRFSDANPTFYSEHSKSETLKEGLSNSNFLPVEVLFFKM